ncbi:Low affinity sulfate transporter 3 [Glycine soja]
MIINGPIIPELELAKQPCIEASQQVPIMREQGAFHLEEHGQTERSQWVLDSPNPPPLWKKLFSSVKETILPHGNKFCFSSKRKTSHGHALSCLKNLFPIISWLTDYKASMFKDDLLAGLTLASLCIPQSIGYATLAKVAPEYGLYTSVVPPLIYAMMGSSREIAIGPVAVVSMLLASLVPKVEDPVANPNAYRNLVFTVTFFTGIFQTAFGVFRLGFLVDFLSHAALVGFMAGAAIIIGLQQLKGLLGLSHFTSKTDVVSVLASVYKSLHNQIASGEKWNPLNFVLGCSFLIFILITRFIGRRNRKLFWLPAISPLLSVILSTLIVYLSRADKHGINIIKHVKGGLNPSSLHQLQFYGPHVGQAAKIGLICSVIALTEAIAVGRSFASIKGYHLDGNKEMLSMGFMNIAGSLSSCYVATGSFSRTAVNFSAGCQTAVSNIVMAITVFVSLELFTRLLYYTPVAILASIILSALPGLIDLSEACYIWKVDKLDFLACIGAFLGVLFASVEIGLLVAIRVAYYNLISNPELEFVGQGKPEHNLDPGQLGILKWVSQDEDDLKETPKGRIQAVILDMTNLMNVDTSGILALEELHKRLLSRGKRAISIIKHGFSNFYALTLGAMLFLQLAMVNPRWLVIHKLKLALFVDKIGKEWVFLTVGEAVDACLSTKIARA